MNIKHFLLAFLLLSQYTLKAQNAKIDSIDQFILRTLEDYGEIPGMAIAVVKDDKAIFTKAYGLSDVQHQRPATPGTAYYIASVTKTFLGVLAGQLAHEGIFSLDDSITSFAPIKNFEDQSIFKGITLQNLLSHTSGITNIPLGWRLSNSGEYLDTELVRLLKDETISRYNGKAYAYDNFGYHVFRLILQHEFGLDWKKLLQEKIFDPLGMKRSTANMSGVDKNNWNLAQAYTGLNDGRTPRLTRLVKNDQTMHAAGGIVSSIEDMQKWLIMNMNQGRLEGKQAVHPDVITQAHSSIAVTRGDPRRLFQDSGYGLGWNTGEYNGRSAHYHTGGFEGYYALISFLPEEGLGVSILVNETHFGDNVGNLIVSYVYDLLLGKVADSEAYAQKKSLVNQQVNRLQRAFAADRQRRKNRKWKLSKELKAFSGTYYNDEMGLMKVSLVEGQSQISIGVSKSAGSQSSEKDAIRVEFRDGRGEDVFFVFGKKRATAAIYRNKVFYRK